MKSIKEFVERLHTDEAFVQTVQSKIKDAVEKGEKDPAEFLIQAARESGYEITKEEIQELQDQQVKELDEEEMGKVAGGTSPLTFTTIAFAPIVIPSIADVVDQFRKINKDLEQRPFTVKADSDMTDSDLD